MKRVLLTGATGFIGKHAIPCVQQRGYEVHAVSTRPVQLDRKKDVVWHRTDLLDTQQSDELLARVRPTHLLHFAWYVEHGKFWNSIDNFHWVEASLRLVRNFQLNGGRRIVAAGTCAEYDWTTEQDLSETQTSLIPRTAYGICKNSLRILTDEFARLTDLSFAWGRIFFLYGKGEPPTRLIPSVIRSLSRNEIAECSHGNQIRDFLYVKDVADAFVALLDTEATGAVNIASGESRTIREVVETIGDLLGKRDKLRFGALRTNGPEAKRIVANVNRLKEEIRWTAKYTFLQGIHETIEEREN